MISFNALAAIALEAGADDIGLAPLSGAWLEREADRFDRWLAQGCAGALEWLKTSAQVRRNPWRLLRAPDAATDADAATNADATTPSQGCAVVLWFSARIETPPKPQGLCGEVAYTGQGRDYHNVARRLLRKLQRAILQSDPEVATFSSCDAGPVLERAFARQAGLGFIGKNTLLIHPKFGSFGHIAVLLLSKQIPGAPERAILETPCGTCERCLKACPTGALGPSGVDVRRCLSFWTIEHRDLLPEDIEDKLGLRIFGCETCQRACPYNAARLKPGCPENPSPERWKPDPARSWPNLISWLDSPPDFTGSALQRPGRDAIQRNVLCALRHAARSPEERDCAQEYFRRFAQDARPIIAQTAARQRSKLSGFPATQLP